MPRWVSDGKALTWNPKRARTEPIRSRALFAFGWGALLGFFDSRSLRGKGPELARFKRPGGGTGMPEALSQVFTC